MSVVLFDAVPRTRPHLRRVRGMWVVLIRPEVAGAFAAMRWADWKNGRHDWYWRAELRRNLGFIG